MTGFDLRLMAWLLALKEAPAPLLAHVTERSVESAHDRLTDLYARGCVFRGGHLVRLSPKGRRALWGAIQDGWRPPGGDAARIAAAHPPGAERGWLAETLTALRGLEGSWSASLSRTLDLAEAEGAARLNALRSMGLAYRQGPIGLTAAGREAVLDFQRNQAAA